MTTQPQRGASEHSLRAGSTFTGLRVGLSVPLRSFRGQAVCQAALNTPGRSDDEDEDPPFPGCTEGRDRVHIDHGLGGRTCVPLW